MGETLRDIARIVIAGLWEKGQSDGLADKDLRRYLLAQQAKLESLTPNRRWATRVWREEVRRILRDGLALKRKAAAKPDDLPGQTYLFDDSES